MSWESFKNDTTSITTVFATKLNGLKEASKIHNINLGNVPNKYDVAYDVNKFTEILSYTDNLVSTINKFNEVITARGMDIVLLTDQADQFVCNAIDAFDRLIDIRTFCINDDLMLVIDNKFRQIKETYLDKFYYTAVSVTYDGSEDIIAFNEAINKMYNEFSKLLDFINQNIIMINLSYSSLDTFSQILKVNTTVGTALSVSSKCWNLAIKLNKNNYSSKLTITPSTIMSPKRLIANYPLKSFGEFPNYIIFDNINRYIDEFDIFNIKNSFDITLNSIESISVVVGTTNITDLYDPGFNLNKTGIDKLNSEISKFYSTFDDNTFIKIIKNAFIINHYDELKALIPSLDSDIIPDVEVLNSYDRLGYNVREALNKNLKQYIIDRNNHNIVHKLFGYKFSTLKTYPTKEELGLDFEQYIPLGLFNNSWLYSNALKSNKPGAKKLYDFLENESSSSYNIDWSAKLKNYIYDMHINVFGYKNTLKNKVVTVYLVNKTENSRTVLKRFEASLNAMENCEEISSARIQFINPLSRYTNDAFKVYNEFSFYLNDKFINTDDPLATDVRDFEFFGKYVVNEGVKNLVSFSLKEDKTLVNGYEGITDRTVSTIRNIIEGEEQYITGPSELTHTVTTYITDNPTVRISTNVANTFRKLLLDGKIGYNDARFKAIFYSIKYLRFREQFDTIIDKSWDLEVPRYSLS